MMEWVSDAAVVKEGFSGKILLSERPAAAIYSIYS